MPDQETLEICETVHGTWHYHVRGHEESRAKCGAMVMRSHMPLEQWGNLQPFHIPLSYCQECGEVLRARHPELLKMPVPSPSVGENLAHYEQDAPKKKRLH